jgi:SAM-dependent methyltransferase
VDLVESRLSEDQEWYDDVRFALAKRVLIRPPIGGVLDFGCGTGGVASRLASAGVEHVVGYDPLLDEQEAALLGSPRVRFTSSLPEKSERFSTVLLMDVVEHVDDPQHLLRQAASFLRPDGKLLVTVPAYRWLWSSHDRALGHRDRYTIPRLLELAQSALSNVQVQAAGYALPTLMLGAALPRLLERLRTPKVDDHQSQLQSESMAYLSGILRRVGIADVATFGAESVFGLTCVCVLRIDPEDSTDV